MIISIKNNRHRKSTHPVKPEGNSIIAKPVLFCIPLAHMHYKMSKTKFKNLTEKNNFEDENCPNYIL